MQTVFLQSPGSSLTGVPSLALLELHSPALQWNIRHVVLVPQWLS